MATRRDPKVAFVSNDNVKGTPEIRRSETYRRGPFVCTACGTPYPDLAKNFAPSPSPMWAHNSGRIPICNNCLDSLYNQYRRLLGDEEEAIRRVCMHFDWYVLEDAILATRSIEATKSRIREYLSKLRRSAHKQDTYDTYLYEKSEEAILDEKDYQAAHEVGDIEVSKDVVKFWGLGFTPSDYEFLEGRYAEWRSRYVITGLARESLVKDICVFDLLRQKAMQAGDTDRYSKLTVEYNRAIDNAGLTPKQEEAYNKSQEMPLGAMLKRFETEKPVPKPDPEWEDVDGIMHIILTYFIGHLCHMLNLKNRYEARYVQEMEKYRVALQMPQDSDAEDIFDRLMENNYKGVQLSSGSEKNVT